MENPDPHPLVESLKSNCSKLEAEIFQLEEKLATDDDSENLSDDISEELQKLDSAKRELAAKLREILSVKRKLGDVPSHSELIQRFCIIISGSDSLGDSFSSLVLYGMTRYLNYVYTSFAGKTSTNPKILCYL